MSYITEQEQLEQIKQWFKDNGPTLALALVMALLVGFGWQRWHYVHERALEHASIRYEELLTSVAANNNEAILRQANYLISRYPRTTYAKLAGLLLARTEVSQGKLDTAAHRLQDILKTAKAPALREIARLRLARLLLAQKKPQQALDLLKKLDDKQYQAPAAEAKGDALLALGKRSEARAAYAQALQLLPAFETTRPLLQMKLDDVSPAMMQGSTFQIENRS